MESYRTEEEQVEALKRWWDENGRSTIAAIVVALAAGFGWQAWKGHDQQQSAAASDLYQALLQQVDVAEATGAPDYSEAKATASQLRDGGSGSYAQFAALHLAKIAVANGDMTEAEAQLRWVLKATSGSGEIAEIAQLRLARVLAATGETDQALAILESGSVIYGGAYGLARGDILLQTGAIDAAREAYTNASILASEAGDRMQADLLEQKLQSLNPQAPRAVQSGIGQATEASTAPAEAEG